MILFIHGFNSSPSQDDVLYLRNQFPTERVITPFIDYTNKVAFDKAMDSLVSLCQEESEIIIVAKSLGCIVARYLSWFSNGLILVNPAFGYKEMLDKYKKMGTIQNFRDESILHTIDVDFLENIEDYEKSAPSLGRGYTFVAEDDEILDSEFVANEAVKNYEVIKVSGGHSIPLSSIDKLKEKIDFLKMYEVM